MEDEFKDFLECINNQIDIPEEFLKVLNDNFWELLL